MPPELRPSWSGPAQLGRERPEQGGHGLRRSARDRRRDAGGHPWPEQRGGCPGAPRPAARERPLGEPRADDDAERDGRERSGRAKPRVVRPAARDPPPDGAQHRRRAPEREREHPGRAGIRARAPAVHQRHRPAGVGEPVHGAPRRQPEPATQEARDRQGEDQVEGERAEPEPQRPVGPGEREHGVDEPDRREAVEHGREHVHREQRHDEQRDGAVQRDEHEARRSLRRPALHLDDAEHDAGGEEHERDQARPAGQVPQRGRSGRGDHGAGAASGQPPVVSTAPVGATSRAGRPASRSHGSALGPSTIAAVLAMFASRHVAAATDTVRQCSAAGAPVRGSIDVMRVAAAPAPAADGRARRRQPARLDRERPARARRARRDGSRRRARASPRAAVARRRRCRRRGSPARPPPRCSAAHAEPHGRRRAPWPSRRGRAGRRPARGRSPHGDRSRRRASRSRDRRAAGGRASRGPRRSRGHSPRARARLRRWDRPARP